MSEPVFSIIIPVYKVEKYIDECVQSVLGQSFRDFELILVDDGSPDGCGAILDGYAAADSRVRVIHQQNGGVAKARTVGAHAAVGSYIMNIDGDDYIENNSLALLAEKIEKFSADVYCFGYYSLSGGTEEEHLPDMDEGVVQNRDALYRRIIFDREKPFFTFGVFPSVWSRVVKRELYLKRQSMIDEKITLGEDFAVTIPIMFEAESIYVIRRPLYCYRVVPGSISRRYNENAMHCVAMIIKAFNEADCIPMDSYGLKEQLGAYCVYSLFNHIFLFVRQNKSFEAFMAYMRTIDESIISCIKNCPLNLKSPKAAFITGAVKCGAWRILWLAARLKKKPA